MGEFRWLRSGNSIVSWFSTDKLILFRLNLSLLDLVLDTSKPGMGADWVPGPGNGKFQNETRNPARFLARVEKNKIDHYLEKQGEVSHSCT